MQTHAEGSRGFALVFVLWMVILLAIVASSLVHGVRRDQTRAALESDTLSAELLADGAINRAILSLVDPRDGMHWHIDGTRQEVILGGRAVDVSVISEAGKIDLNAASANLLASVLASSGAGPSESQLIADRIVAWRSPAIFASVDADTASYLNSGRVYTPRHSAFRTVGELRMVLGMTTRLQDAISPLLTVYTNSPNIDIAVAGEDLLRALAAGGNQFAAVQLAARLNGDAAGADRRPAAGESLMIEARVTQGLCTADRRATVRITSGSGKGYQVLSWR